MRQEVSWWVADTLSPEIAPRKVRYTTPSPHDVRYRTVPTVVNHPHAQWAASPRAHASAWLAQEASPCHQAALESGGYGHGDHSCTCGMRFRRCGRNGFVS